jgi:uncharacterized membrane protein YfcA
MVVLEQYLPHIAVTIAALILYRRDRQAFLVGSIIAAITSIGAYFLTMQLNLGLVNYTTIAVGISSMLSGYLGSHLRAERLVLEALIEKVQSE